MRRTMTTTLALALATTLALPALAVTNGTLDGDDHPFVGMLAAVDEEGDYLFRCTGTLMSPTVVLTAGHCVTDGYDEAGDLVVVPRVLVYFSNGEVDGEIPDYDPDDPYLDPAGADAAGTPYAHPQYDDGAFYLWDLGVVVLDEPVEMDTYGALPTLGLVDTFKNRKGQVDATVTAVGYGLQAASANGKKDVAERDRYQARLDIVNTTGTAGVPAGTAFTTSGNAKTGGTCFGDSGGPNFLQDTNVVLGVTSFGLNANCGGIGGVYRVDAADDLDWLAGFGLTP